MANSTDIPNLAQRIPNLAQPTPTRTKIRVDPKMLPMLVTILPAQIVGSEKSEPYVTLVIEGIGLPKSEFSTVDVNRESDGRVVTEIKGMNS